MTDAVPDMDITTTETRTTTVVAKLTAAQLSSLLEAAVRTRVKLPADQPGVKVDVSVQAMPDGSTGAAIKIVVDHQAVDANPAAETAAEKAEPDAERAAPAVPAAEAEQTAAAAAAPSAAKPSAGIPGFPLAHKAA